MGLYLGAEKVALFKGDYRPVNLYHGDKKAAGWVWSDKSGEAADWEDTYNDTAYAKADGRSEQNGEPTPDNPVSIICAGDCELVSRGKNLLDALIIPQITQSGVTCTYSAQEKTITLNGTNTTTSFMAVYLPTPVQLNLGQRYCLAQKRVSGDISGTTAGFYLGSSNTPITSNNWVQTSLLQPHTSATAVAAHSLLTRVWIYALLGTVFDNLTFRIQVEEGSVATPYQPYRAPSYIAVPVLRSLPTGVADTLEYTGAGVWRHTQNIVGKVLSGAEIWGKNQYRYQTVITPLTPRSETYGSNILCTHFMPGLQNTQYNGSGDLTASVFAASAEATYFGCQYNGIADIPAFRQWLAAQHAAGTPVTVHYQLAAPIITDIDLGALKTFPRFTRLEQIGGELSLQITAQARIIDRAL